MPQYQNVVSRDNSASEACAHTPIKVRAMGNVDDGDTVTDFMDQVITPDRSPLSKLMHHVAPIGRSVSVASPSARRPSLLNGEMRPSATMC